MVRKRSWATGGVLVLVMALVGCSDDEPSSSKASPFGQLVSPLENAEQALSRASQLGLGAAVAAELGGARWSITLNREEGELTAELDAATGNVLKLVGRTLPEADRDIDPGSEFITLLTGHAVALEGSTDELLRWELDRDRDGRWIWDFYVRAYGASDAELEIEIDALSGALLRDQRAEDNKGFD